MSNVINDDIPDGHISVVCVCPCCKEEISGFIKVDCGLDECLWECPACHQILYYKVEKQKPEFETTTCGEYASEDDGENSFQ